MQDLVSPCCNSKLETIVFYDGDIEIQCLKCSNLWESDGRFVSY